MNTLLLHGIVSYFLVVSCGLTGKAMDSLEDVGERSTSRRRGLALYRQEFVSPDTNLRTVMVKASLENAMMSGKGIRSCGRNSVELDNVMDEKPLVVSLGEVRQAFSGLREDAKEMRRTFKKNSVKADEREEERWCFDFERAPRIPGRPVKRWFTPHQQFDNFVEQKDLQGVEKGVPCGYAAAHSLSRVKSIKDNRSDLVGAVQTAADSKEIVAALEKPVRLTGEDRMRLQWLKFKR